MNLKITPPCVCGGVGAPRLSCVQSLPGGGRFPFTHGPQSPGHTPACAPPSSQASGTRHCRSACRKLSLKGLKHAEPMSCSSCSLAGLPAHSAPGHLTPREAGDDRGGTGEATNSQVPHAPPPALWEAQAVSPQGPTATPKPTLWILCCLGQSQVGSRSCTWPRARRALQPPTRCALMANVDMPPTWNSWGLGFEGLDPIRWP